MESKNKTWRFSSEDEFLDYAIEYVTNHVDSIVEKIDTFPNDKAKKLKSKIKDYYFIYRFKYTNKYDLLKIGISIVIEDVDNWREFSSDVFSPLKDIVTRAILGKMFKANYVSYTLLYHNENITEDFLEDMIYIDSPLFSFDEWDDQHVTAVCNCAAALNKMNDDEELKKVYHNRELTANKIKIRLNLDEYNVSKEFLNKYKNHIKNSKIAELI